jgi:hypothetical protein
MGFQQKKKKEMYLGTSSDFGNTERRLLKFCNFSERVDLSWRLITLGGGENRQHLCKELRGIFSLAQKTYGFKSTLI